MHKTYNKAFLCSLCLHLLLVPVFLGLIGIREESFAPKDDLIELEMVSLGAGEAGEEGRSGGSGPVKEVKTPASPLPELKAPAPAAVKAVKPLVKSEVKTKPTKESKALPAEKAVTSSSKTAGQAATNPGLSGSGSGSGGTGGQGTGTGTGIGSGTGSGSSGTGGGGGGNGSGSGSGSGKIPKDYIPPQILSRVEPKYPVSAREQGITGTVRVKVQVTADGRAGSVSIRQSSGSSLLDQAAVDAVRKWRFVPAKDRSTGKAFSCVTSFPVVFRLK